MTGSGLQGWHVSLFVSFGIALIVVIEWIIAAALRGGRSQPQTPKARLVDNRVRAGLLVLLSAVAVVIVAVGLLGPSLADQLAGVTAAVLGVVTMALAYLSYQESLKLSAQIRAAAESKDVQSEENRAT
ncbi:hypothetical protein AB0M02_45745 [Actinoplanes sp. NPDC051861]|uniref:hypothetical protein n=1 Tax=Actinoplanes sp. NPDC051861 TaxID=3155170 RepID=UPI00341A6529